MEQLNSLIQLETLEAIDRAMFETDELHKMASMCGNDATGICMKINKATDKTVLTCISLWNQEIAPDETVLSELNAESPTKFYCCRCVDGRLLLCSALTVYGKLLKGRCFDTAFERLYDRHFNARERLEAVLPSSQE